MTTARHPARRAWRASRSALAMPGRRDLGGRRAPAPRPTGALHVVATTTDPRGPRRARSAAPTSTSRASSPRAARSTPSTPRPSDVRASSRRTSSSATGWASTTGWRTSSGTPAPRRTMVALGENLPGVPTSAASGAAGPVNPHVWLDIALCPAATWTASPTSLAAADPAHAAATAARAATYGPSWPRSTPTPGRAGRDPREHTARSSRSTTRSRTSRRPTASSSTAPS